MDINRHLLTKLEIVNTIKQTSEQFYHIQNRCTNIDRYVKSSAEIDNPDNMGEDRQKKWTRQLSQ